MSGKLVYSSLLLFKGQCGIFSDSNSRHISPQFLLSFKHNWQFSYADNCCEDIVKEKVLQSTGQSFAYVCFHSCLCHSKDEPKL